MQQRLFVDKPPSRARVRGGGPWVLALAACLVILPAAPAASAREPGPPRPTQVTAAPADPTPPPLSFADARFRRVGPRHQIKSRSGMKVTTSLGRWSARGADARGAEVEIRSPWGEKLAIDLVLSDTAMLAEINGRTQVLTTFDAEHRPLDLQVTVDGVTTRSHLGDAARRFAAGAPLPADFDARAHQALALALHDELSPAFLTELASLERPEVEVGCYWQLTQCIGAITVWAIDIALLPAACLVAGVPTFGISCALAIIGHELTNLAVVGACTQYATCHENENTPPEEPDESTPIILDLDGRGFRLTGLDDPVVFDLDADGSPDRVSWTRRNGDEAFLVLDRNRNGRIDDGGELFGSRTPMVDGILAAHGFMPLTEYDLRAFGGNQNGEIDAGDRIFDRLMLWNDRNRDGRTDAGELRTLQQAGVVALGLDYRIDGRRDRHGNKFVVNSKAFVQVRGHRQPRAMSDVYLQMLD